MKLEEGERKIAEYYFKDTGDVSNISVLTNRRLVVIYRNVEESYSLSEITAVRVIINRVWNVLFWGAALAYAGAAGLLTGRTIVVGLVLLALGGGLVYLGWKGKTYLFISQIGGGKYYTVRRKDPKLIEFIDAANGWLALVRAKTSSRD